MRPSGRKGVALVISSRRFRHSGSQRVCHSGLRVTSGIANLDEAAVQCRANKYSLFTLALTRVEDLELPVWTVGRSLSSWRGATQRLDGETCKLPSERAELIVKLALKSLYNINRCGLYIMNIESITPTYVKGIWTVFKLQSVLPHIRILLAAR